MREQDLEFNPEYKYAKGGKASDETYREVYQHKYIPTMTFEITGETANGYKGIQKDKKSLSKLERTKGKKVSYSSSDLKDLFTKMYAKGGKALLVSQLKIGDKIKDEFGYELEVYQVDSNKVYVQAPSGTTHTYYQKDFDNGIVNLFWSNKSYAKGGEVDDYIMVNKKDFYNDTWKAVSINNKIKVWNKTYNRKEYDKLLDNESFVFRHLSNTSSSDPTNFKTKKIDGYMRSALYLPKYSFIKSGSAKGFVDVSDLDDILSYAKGGKFAKGGKVSADDFTPYARICDVTGEGMNEGWLMGDSFYVKYEKDLIKELRKDFPNQKDLSDNELMEEAYEEEYYYYTEWEDPSDVEYVEYKGKLYEKDELEDEIPAKDFEVFKGAYGIIFEEDYYAKGGKTKKFPVAVKRRVDEINEMLPKVNESGDYASTYAGSTMESYIILDKPIQIKGNYVYISEKDSRWGKYGFEKRYNVNDTRDVYESIKGRKALMSDLGIIKRAFTKLLKSEGKMAKGGKTKKFPKGFIDYVEESDNVYEDNGLYYNVETQYAKAFTLQELYDWTQKEGYEFAKGGIAKKSEYISNRDIVSLTHKKGGTKKTLKGSQLVDGAYAKKKIMRKKPTKSDQLSLLNKGGEIVRAYDVNINSGVGTYAKGGKIMGVGKSGLDKIKKTSKQNPKQMYKVTDDNYSNIGNFYLKNGKFAKKTSANADYDFAKNKVSLRPKSDVIYKATEIEGKGGYYARGGKTTMAGDTDFPSELLNYAKGGKTKGGVQLYPSKSGKSKYWEVFVDFGDDVGTQTIATFDTKKDAFEYRTKVIKNPSNYEDKNSWQGRPSDIKGVYIDSLTSDSYAKGGKFASGGNVSYNGWTNYATWVTNLEILDGIDWEEYNMGEPISAEQIEDYVQEVMEQSPNLALSFANRFLNDVNYREIAENANDDFDLDDGEKDDYAKGGQMKKPMIRYSGRR